MWVAVVQNMPFIGRSTLEKCIETIRKYPDHFPWEHQYTKIPNEVHEEFKDEMNPDRHKPVDWDWNNDPPRKSVMEQIKEKSYTYREVTYESVIKMLDDVITRENNERIAEQQQIAREKTIWNKHYKKYNLKYRESFIALPALIGF